MYSEFHQVLCRTIMYVSTIHMKIYMIQCIQSRHHQSSNCIFLLQAFSHSQTQIQNLDYEIFSIKFKEAPVVPITAANYIIRIQVMSMYYHKWLHRQSLVRCLSWSAFVYTGEGGSMYFVIGLINLHATPIFNDLY